MLLTLLFDAMAGPAWTMLDLDACKNRDVPACKRLLEGSTREVIGSPRVSGSWMQHLELACLGGLPWACEFSGVEAPAPGALERPAQHWRLQRRWIAVGDTAVALDGGLLWAPSGVRLTSTPGRFVGGGTTSDATFWLVEGERGQIDRLLGLGPSGLRTVAPQVRELDRVVFGGEVPLAVTSGHGDAAPEVVELGDAVRRVPPPVDGARFVAATGPWRVWSTKTHWHRTGPGVADRTERTAHEQAHLSSKGSVALDSSGFRIWPVGGPPMSLEVRNPRDCAWSRDGASLVLRYVSHLVFLDERGEVERRWWVPESKGGMDVLSADTVRLGSFFVGAVPETPPWLPSHREELESAIRPLQSGRPLDMIRVHKNRFGWGDDAAFVKKDGVWESHRLVPFVSRDQHGRSAPAPYRYLEPQELRSAVPPWDSSHGRMPHPEANGAVQVDGVWTLPRTARDPRAIEALTEPIGGRYTLGEATWSIDAKDLIAHDGRWYLTTGPTGVLVMLLRLSDDDFWMIARGTFAGEEWRRVPDSP